MCIFLGQALPIFVRCLKGCGTPSKLKRPSEALLYTEDYSLLVLLALTEGQTTLGRPGFLGMQNVR